MTNTDSIEEYLKENYFDIYYKNNSLSGIPGFEYKVNKNTFNKFILDLINKKLEKNKEKKIKINEIDNIEKIIYILLTFEINFGNFRFAPEFSGFLSEYKAFFKLKRF